MIGSAQENFGILRICSTPNFVLCLANMPGGPLFLFAINKKDPSIQTKIEVGDCTEPCTFKSSGSYCALLVGRELHVYEDSSDAQFRLVRTHHIQQGLPLWRGTTQMYKNWVCVYKDGLFCIFDVRNGQEVISLKKDWGSEVCFQVNARALLVFHMFGTMSGRFTSTKLCLYDFSKKVQQLPSSGGCSVM